jgi:hypothetical protein
MPAIPAMLAALAPIGSGRIAPLSSKRASWMRRICAGSSK